MKKQLIRFFLIILAAGISTTFAQKKQLQLEDIWASRQFYASGLTEVRSMNDGESYSEMKEAGSQQVILKISYATGKITDTLFKSSTGNISKTIDDYSLSENENLILLSTETESIYRHSTKANHYVFNRKTGKTLEVSSHGKQQYAVINAICNQVAFVRDNNIFITDLNTGNEKQITSDGLKNSIINGATDWVYEEEFAFDRAYQWSPDGKHIAFYRFDESKVKEFNLTYYGDLYPREEKYKYPKAGEANSLVEIYIYDTQNGKTVKADVNKEADQYIPRIKWTSDASKLCVMRMNRLQNHLELYSVDATSGTANKFFTEESRTYIEVSDHLTFLSSNSGFIWTSSQSGWNHIYRYGMDGKLQKQITSGNFDVTDFYGVDEKTGKLYFQAAVKSPMNKDVYAIDSKGSMKQLSNDAGTSTGMFSKGFRYRFITTSALNHPPVVKLYNAAGKNIRTEKDNREVKSAMASFNLTNGSFFKMTTSENVELNGWMIKPADFDPNKKYPVIQYMYGGPGSQTVKDEWMGPNYFWFQLLAQKGYIIVSVDNRGTGARGEEFNKCTYLKLGHYETIDQMEVAKWLGKQPYVDATRIGAWGWSFGGYMTSLLATKGADLFKTCIAVAPVTNWKYYDSIYTERFLRTPQANPEGYEDNSPINFTSLLKGNYMIIHGTTDDNVHMQNSMDMVTALVKDKKQFDSFFYPNKAHGISGVRLHLYKMMTEYFEQKL